MRSVLPLRPVVSALFALALSGLAAAAPQTLDPGTALELALTPAAPKTELTFANDGTHLVALRVIAAAPDTAVRFKAKAAAKFGAYGLTSDLQWDFKSERAASQLFDGLPQYPATWTIELALTGKEPRSLTVQLEDQGAAPDVRWGEATGSLLVRNTGQTRLTATPERGFTLRHPLFKGPAAAPDTTPAGDALFRLPAGYWQLVAGGGEGVRELRSTLIPVSSGGETVVDWPQMRTLEGEKSKGLTELVLRDATADGETGRLLVAAPMFSEAPKPEAVRIVEGGQPGQVLSVESIPAKLHVVVLFDSSFSMRKIFAQAQEAALRFVEKLPAECTVDFIDFDTKVKDLPAADRATLLDAIRALKSEGSTRLYDAIMRGLSKCAGHRRSAIVVFTDGFDAQVDDPGYGSRATPEQVFDAVAKTPVPLFTIGYGEKPDVETLKRLADASGGATFRAQPDTIADVFAQIGRLVDRDYRITYRRPAKVAASNTPVLTLVLDVSGSMDMDPKNPVCGYRIEKAKDLLRGFFGRLPAGSVVQLFTFSDNVDLVQVLTADPTRLLRALAPINAGGGTETLKAAQAALASLEKIPSHNRYLLFITDAALSVPDAAQHKKFEEVLAAFKDQGIRSLWVGMVDTKEQAPFESAARLSGGSFVVSPGTDSLAKALASLEKSLKEPGAGGNEIAVEVLIDKPDAAGAHHLHGGTGLFALPVSGFTAEHSVGCLTATINNAPASEATGPAVVSLAPSPASAPSAPPSAAATAESLELNRIPLELVGHNDAVEITVHRATLYSKLHGIALPDPYRFVVLSVTLKNNLPEQEVFVPDKGAMHPAAWVTTGRPPGKIRRATPPYVIPDLRHHVFLRWNEAGECPPSLLSALETPPLFLPGEPEVTVTPGQPLEGNLVFLVQGANLQSASLHFYDTNYHHMDLALVGPLAPRPEALADLPTQATGALSDTFTVRLLGSQDSGDAVGGVAPGTGNVFRLVQLAFESRVQALADLKPSAQFALLIHTDKGLLSTPLAPLTDGLPGGLYRDLSLAPGSHNRFQQIYCVPAALKSRPTALFMELKDRDFVLPFDRPLLTAPPAGVTVPELGLSAAINDMFLTGKDSGFGRPLLAVDVTVADTDDRYSTQLKQLFRLEPVPAAPGSAATETKEAPSTEAVAKRRGLGSFASGPAQPERARPPLATAQELLFGFSENTVVPDGANRRGVLLFDVPPAGEWRLTCNGQELARVATPRAASPDDQWLMTRRPKYPLFDEASPQGRVEKLIAELKSQGVFRNVVRAGQQAAAIKTDLAGKPRPVEALPPRLTAAGAERWTKLLAGTEKDLWATLANLRVAGSAEKPWNSSSAPEAVLTQDSGTAADLANLALQWFAARGVTAEPKQAKLSEAGKSWFRAHAAGEPPASVPLLTTPQGTWAFPFLAKDGDAATFLAGAATNAGKADIPETELIVAVYCESAKPTAAGKIADMASALGGGAAGPTRFILWSGRLPNSALSRDAVDLFYVESGPSRDRIVRARLESAAGVVTGPTGFNPAEWKPVREELTIRFLGGKTLPPAVRELHDGKLGDIFHSLALVAPDLPTPAAETLARLSHEQKPAERPDGPSIVRWLARAKIAAFLAAQTRWEEARRADLGVGLSRAARPRAIIYTAATQNGAFVQSLDLRQSDPDIYGDPAACAAFRLMAGLTSTAFEGRLVGAKSVLDFWKSPGDFVTVAPKNRDRFARDLKQKGFPDEVVQRVKSGSEYLLFSKNPVDSGGRPLWGWLAIDPATYAVTSVLSTGENGAAETSLLDMLQDAESYGIGFYVGVDSSVWSVAAFTLEGLPYAEVLNEAEAFAHEVAENFNGIGVEPKEVAEVMWKKFSLIGSEYIKGDASYRKFSDGYNAGVKLYFDRARGRP
jgi:Mg-chelatase subunit ChlD